MRFLGKTFGVLLGLTSVGVLGVGVYLGAKRLLSLFQRLDFRIDTVAAVGVLALLLAATIIARSIRHAAARNGEAHLYRGKVEAYRMFIGFWEELLRSGLGPETETRLSEQLQDVNHLLVLHGSAAMVKAHIAMQEHILPEARAQFGDALLEIRKDLGLESRGLPAQELLRLLLTEPETAPIPVWAGAHQDTQPRISLARN